jgi:hypothetical protein
MPKTVFAMITLLEDGSFGGRPDNSLPGYGGSGDPGYDKPIHHPGHPDHGLPSRPDHIGGGPIYHPGHPDHGLPSQPGHPGNRPPGSGGGYPSQGLPGQGGRPDNSLPWSPGSPDQGLPVPPGVTPPPAPGGALRDQLVVLWHMPGQTEWHGKVIDPATINRPDQGLPAQPPPTAGTPLPPTPEPKK